MAPSSKNLDNMIDYVWGCDTSCTSTKVDGLRQFETALASVAVINTVHTLIATIVDVVQKVLSGPTCHRHHYRKHVFNVHWRGGGRGGRGQTKDSKEDKAKTVARLTTCANIVILNASLLYCLP